MTHPLIVPAVNWNRIDDPFDLEVWNRLTSQFWLPEKVPLAGDLSSWETLTDYEKLATTRVLTGLTLLDTIQGVYGATSMIPDARTMHEEAVLANITFMECMTAEHDLLTPTGWKPIAEIRKGDTVAQYNPDSQELEFVQVVETSSHVPDKTYVLESPKGHIRQHVSPGHRVVLERKNGHGEWEMEIVEARDLTPDHLTDQVRFINTAPPSPHALSTDETPVRFRRVVGSNDREAYLPSSQAAEHAVAVATAAGFSTAVATGDDFYRFTVKADSRHTSAAHTTITEAPAERVYGVEVPSTFLITRNGPSITVTGNCVHAKSYSSIFSTLCSTEQIDDAFRWAEENEFLQKKAEIIMAHYDGDAPLKRKVASTLLESFLFFSGFYLPLHWSSRAKLTNTADIIRLIIRDEAVHGQYLGYKYQLGVQELSAAEQSAMQDFTYDLLYELYENEVKFTAEQYDGLALTEDVKRYLHYNANKALMNLGYEPLFDKEAAKVSASILASLSGGENHDFFSGSGSTYTMSTAEDTTDDDWDF